MTRSAVVGISILSFLAGGTTTWLLNRPDVLPLSTSLSAPDAQNVPALYPKLEAIDRRLAEIESSLASAVGGKSNSSPDLSTPTRTNDKALDEIRAELESLRDEMRARLAGLGELQALKPQPDARALDDLRARCGKDQNLVKAHFLGMTYRDVVLQFGSPSVKFPALNGPPRSHLETWIWESSNGDLDVEFVNGAVIGAALNRSGVIRKFMEDLESR